MEKKANKFPSIVLSALCIVLAYVIMTTVIGIATMPIRYDIKAGMVSPVTITATKDVVDTIQTESLREAAAKQVEPSYVLDSTVASSVLNDLDEAIMPFVALGVPEGPERSRRRCSTPPQRPLSLRSSRLQGWKRS